MDGLSGNIQIAPMQPVAEIETKSKQSNKRRKSARAVDIDRSPSVKKQKLSTIATPEPEERPCVLSRKSQCLHFNAFCSEYQFPEQSDQEYIAMSYKHFTKCKVTDLNTLLIEFLSTYLSNWELEKDKLSENGAPLLLFISSSAVRALELARDAREALGQNCTVAKLFAKHMKIDQQKKFLSSHICHIATGTPQRLLQIIESYNFLKSTLKLVVLDWQRKDAKQRRLIDISENKEPLSNFLRQHVIPLVLTCQTKLFLL